jgi:hypothetical protein
MTERPMSLIYSRRDKLNHVDTILYEIDMLRFAAGRLVEGKWREPRDAWVYLEAFLIHYRNLIEFLGKPNPRDTDLHVTTIWQLVNLAPPARLDKIHADGAKLLNEYEPSDKQGGGRISQYLQHCTTKRIDFKEWRIDTMSKQIEPLLWQVEQCLGQRVRILKPAKAVEFQESHAASTTTLTITPNVIPLIDFERMPKKWPR